MCNTKENRPRCCEHRERAGTEKSVSNSPASDYRTTSPIMQVLPKSRETALTASELARLTGTKPRAITRQIERLRYSGTPICAETGETPGYWITDDPADLARYCRSLDRRLRNIRQTREAIGNALTEMTGQLDFTSMEVQHEQEEDGIPKETL